MQAYFREPSYRRRKSDYKKCHALECRVNGVAIRLWDLDLRRS